ncbi:MAG: endonuclease/exonuclease/phosphatase family protein [Oscillospiraceae bacterium]|nr:endonuclease/exonuclease/phosphatase family protein [Oscillospiraceae bacterium]
MNKAFKIVIIAVSAAAVCALATVAMFFAMNPLHPNVEIKPDEARVAENEVLYVSSYNTAAPWGNLINGTHTTRRANLFAQQINDSLPDSLGVQEINSNWVEKMEELLPQYGYYGVKRGGDSSENTSEMSGIFYLKNKFELLESDTFWISDTPETESKFDGAGCNRVCSYVVLRNKTTGDTYAHLNTHLDNVSVEAQALGGELICEKAADIAEKYGDIAIVITGDFNQYSDGAACTAVMDGGFVNASEVMENGDNTVTYNDWGKIKTGKPIDFIFVNGNFKVQDYSVSTNSEVETYISDHYMITAELKIK